MWGVSRNPKGNAMQHEPVRRNSDEPAWLANAPRCQARTKQGVSCRSKAVRGKRVCRMHGGTNKGAPHGDRNDAYRHGGETKEAIALRAAARRLMRALEWRADSLT
jgi:hypothetical protein